MVSPPIADPDDPGLRRLDMDHYFTLLRGTARTSNRRLAERRAIIDGSEILLPARCPGVARQALAPARQRRTV
jgi:hypothetical protein